MVQKEDAFKRKLTRVWVFKNLLDLIDGREEHTIRVDPKELAEKCRLTKEVVMRCMPDIRTAQMPLAVVLDPVEFNPCWSVGTKIGLKEVGVILDNLIRTDDRRWNPEEGKDE